MSNIDVAPSFKELRVISWICPTCKASNRAGNTLDALNGTFSCKCCNHRFTGKWEGKVHTLEEIEPTEEYVWSIFKVPNPHGWGSDDKGIYFIVGGVKDLTTGKIKYDLKLEDYLNVPDDPSFFMACNPRCHLETVGFKDLLVTYGITPQQFHSQSDWIMRYHFRKYIKNGRNAANVLDMIWWSEFKIRGVKFDEKLQRIKFIRREDGTEPWESDQDLTKYFRVFPA